jgi:hypothetical protein
MSIDPTSPAQQETNKTASWLERLVTIGDEKDIDTLNPGDVVNVKNQPPYVFDKKERDRVTFYFANIMGEVIKFTTSRDYIGAGGNRILINSSGFEDRKVLTPGDEDYERMKADLVAIGLMKEG